MKLKKANLKHGVEIPSNEPNMTSESYELEVVPTNVGGMLKARLRTSKPGEGEFFVPLGNLNYFVADPNQPSKK